LHGVRVPLPFPRQSNDDMGGGKADEEEGMPPLCGYEAAARFLLGQGHALAALELLVDLEEASGNGQDSPSSSVPSSSSSSSGVALAVLRDYFGDSSLFPRSEVGRHDAESVEEEVRVLRGRVDAAEQRGREAEREGVRLRGEVERLCEALEEARRGTGLFGSGVADGDGLGLGSASMGRRLEEALLRADALEGEVRGARRVAEVLRTDKDRALREVDEVERKRALAVGAMEEAQEGSRRSKAEVDEVREALRAMQGRLEEAEAERDALRRERASSSGTGAGPGPGPKPGSGSGSGSEGSGQDFLRGEGAARGILGSVARALPGLADLTLAGRREEVWPVAVAVAAGVGEGGEREALVRMILLGIRRPDGRQRRACRDALEALADEIGEWATASELLPIVYDAASVASASSRKGEGGEGEGGFVPTAEQRANCVHVAAVLSQRTAATVAMEGRLLALLSDVAEWGGVGEGTEEGGEMVQLACADALRHVAARHAAEESMRGRRLGAEAEQDAVRLACALVRAPGAAMREALPLCVSALVAWLSARGALHSVLVPGLMDAAAEGIREALRLDDKPFEYARCTRESTQLMAVCGDLVAGPVLEAAEAELSGAGGKGERLSARLAEEWTGLLGDGGVAAAESPVTAWLCGGLCEQLVEGLCRVASDSSASITPAKYEACRLIRRVCVALGPGWTAACLVPRFQGEDLGQEAGTTTTVWSPWAYPFLLAGVLPCAGGNGDDDDGMASFARAVVAFVEAWVSREGRGRFPDPDFCVAIQMVCEESMAVTDDHARMVAVHAALLRALWSLVASENQKVRSAAAFLFALCAACGGDEGRMMSYLSALIGLGNDGDEVVRLDTVLALGVIPRGDGGGHPRVLEKLGAQVDIMLDLHGSAALVRSLVRDVLTVGSLPLDRAFAAAVYGAFDDRSGHPVSPAFRDTYAVKRLRALAGDCAKTATLLASATDGSSAAQLGGVARAKEVTEHVVLLLDALQAMLPSLEAAAGDDRVPHAGGAGTPGRRGGGQGVINLGQQNCADEGAEALRDLEVACKALAMPSGVKQSLAAVSSGWKHLQARRAGGRAAGAAVAPASSSYGGSHNGTPAKGAGGLLEKTSTPSKKESSGSSYSSMMAMMGMNTPSKGPKNAVQEPQIRPAFTLEDSV